MNYLAILGFTILTIIGLIILFISTIIKVLNDIFNSITIPQIGSIELDPKDTQNNILFKTFPQLAKVVPWIKLGDYPTPIHKASIPSLNIKFYLKREDLCSPKYGGNKVRALQYSLAICQLHSQKHPKAQFHVMGSGGSNQAISTVLFGALLGLAIRVGYIKHDLPDLDNTLNFLSVLSFKPQGVITWDHKRTAIREIISALYFSKTNDRIFFPGGSSIPGILGQMEGALELAYQIQNGEMPDPDRLILPLGSSCTTTGLILGICLARKLGIDAFKSLKFKLVSVAIDKGLAALHRKTGIYKSMFGKVLPMTPLFGITKVCGFLTPLIGIDLYQDAVDFIHQEWEFVTDEKYVGHYGSHTEISKQAAKYDSELNIKGDYPQWITNPPIPWLCGHFTAKAFAVLLDHLQSTNHKDDIVLFWQTKSHVQPVSSQQTEWIVYKDLIKQSVELQEWSDKGISQSVLRPGKVDYQNGTPNDYRHLMKEIEMSLN
ncbi:tryptophan synthase beta subunit-like PLP-dependent enzyme [Globomyces pollinis-pini]|nr:tryptophan synthase beta subunit-like PLP-dependent enzyme [Globomyces pollinis-pini]